MNSVEKINKVEEIVETFNGKEETALALLLSGDTGRFLFTGNSHKLTYLFKTVLKEGLKEDAEKQPKHIVFALLEAMMLVIKERGYAAINFMNLLNEALGIAVLGGDNRGTCDEEADEEDEFEPDSERCLSCNGYQNCLNHFLMENNIDLSVSKRHDKK